MLETLDSTLASISSRRAAAALTLGEHDRQVSVRLRDVLERQKDGGGKRRGGGASSSAAAVGIGPLLTVNDSSSGRDPERMIVQNETEGVVESDPMTGPKGRNRK